MTSRVLLLIVGLGFLAGCGGPDILKTEPRLGSLPKGDSVLVDDGRCPAGQVSKVTGAESLTTPRSYSCVKKPSD